MSAGQIIHVVDDDPDVRDSLAFMLTAADLKVEAYESAAALLARGPALESGCIITDVRMPGMNGLELIAKLKENGAPQPVIVLTGHGDVGLAVAAMKAGIVDFLEKPFNEAALLQAVQTALARGEDETSRLAERQEVEARIALLTARERDVFEAIVSGDSNKAAAQKLGISPRTVEIYRANVMDKMQAKTLSELVRMSLLRELR